MNKENPCRSRERKTTTPMQWALDVIQEMEREEITCEDMAEELGIKPKHVKAILARSYPCKKMEKKFLIALENQKTKKIMRMIFSGEVFEVNGKKFHLVQRDFTINGGGGG